MFKRIALVAGLVAALMLSATAFAQAPASLPATYATRINFVPGTSLYTFSAKLAPGAPQRYVLGASGGQFIYVTKTGDASVEVLDDEGNILAAPTAQPGPWGVKATQDGDYTIVLDGEATAAVSVYIPPANIAQSFSTITPFFQQRINFAAGNTGYSFVRDFQQGRPLAFALGISAGQKLNVTTQGNLTAAVLGLDGNPLPAASSQYGEWHYAIPATGNYTLVLAGTGRDLTSIAIPPLGSNPPPAVATRVRFLPGTASATVFANEQKGYPAPQYLLGIGAGQTLYVSTRGAVSGVQVFDSSGNQIPAFAMSNGSLAFGISRTDDYRVVVYGSGQISVTFYIPPL